MPDPAPETPAALAEGAAIRDLMGLLALPALWAAKDGRTVMRLTVDAVCRIAPVDVVFARVPLPPVAEAVVFFKHGSAPPGESVPPAWLPFIKRCDTAIAAADRLSAQDSPMGPLRVLYLRMGAGRQTAHICFGSRDPAFPTANHGAFVRAAVSLAASGLNTARSEYERQQAQRAKDEFLAMLGHELRNPLAPIVTTLGLIRIKGSGALARELEVIERQVGHLSRLVDDLLDITRITRDQVELRRSVVGLRGIVVAAIESVSPLLEERRHQISVSLVDEGRIDADADRVRQVFSNLLVNAAKYTPPGGHIQVGSTVQGNMVEVAVQDNGVGIEASLLPRVFDLFEQGKMTIDRARGGLGLGLAIVKKLTLLHGGEVSAQSEGDGKGSRFVVRLPLVAPDRDRPAPSAGGLRHEAARTQRVLLVDDNADALQTMQELLSMSGYEVATARDPVEALQKAPAFLPHVYVLDIGLPGLDGYQLAAELRRQGGEQAARARFIALTGYGQASDKARAIEAGFHQHLVKPVEVDKLLAALE